MKKVLIVTTISGFVPQFEMNNVRILQRLGYEVHYAANFDNPVYGDDNKRLDNTGIICHQVNFARSPYKLHNNVIAYKQLNDIMKRDKFDLVHCHTPVGGVLGRLAAKANHVKVIYTAHGFHFYKGGPFINWIIYYPIERLLSKHTDLLITINSEDYRIAKSFNTCNVLKINGVGFDINEYRNLNVSKPVKCKELGIDPNQYILCTVAELNKNKNYSVVLKAIHNLKLDNFIYLICGNGNKRRYYEKLVNELGIVDKVKFLGHRKDVKEILAISDCFIFPSKREGLGMAALEAMASGLPLIAADSRGTREYAADGKTGFVYQYNDDKGFTEGIDQLLKDSDMRKRMGGYNKTAVFKFDSSNVSIKMEKVYKTFE